MSSVNHNQNIDMQADKDVQFSLITYTLSESVSSLCPYGVNPCPAEPRYTLPLQTV